MCDADLDTLGREDFPELNRRLQEEHQRILKSPPNPQVWLANQVRFLEDHSFFTRARMSFGTPARRRTWLASAPASIRSMAPSPAR